ncbi:exodeoxyribonuclease V subunit alpha [Geobacter pickeringii]|uniref:exodeoxyribonuclease V subunit alpha n=1 Tax=Geobacter pickeringii TaxID=345632 RepID=UPI0006923A9A|nr:exodeoxyribonuclease V subunit alpha [Geobacter pickeringii]
MLSEATVLRDIDHRFAEFIGRIALRPSEELTDAVRALSSAVGQGHVCIDLTDGCAEGGAQRRVEALRASGAVGRPGEHAPLILDEGGRLYLYRYWRYESDLAETLKEKASVSPEVDGERLADGIVRLFGPPDPRDIDWQRIAAAAAVRSCVSVISGGPGTGKTSTVVRIMALLLEQGGERPVRIALAAPTGKAAARLRESIRGAKERLAVSGEIRDLIPDEVMTLHRLLGVIPDSNRFRHHADHLLPYDVVIVDEASMVALPLMAKLAAALGARTRLILLGDRDQLASVEAGAVLGDICDVGRLHRFSLSFRQFVADVTGEGAGPGDAEPDPAPLADSVVILRRNYRFGTDSGIGRLSRLVNEGEAEGALALLHGEEHAGVTWRETPAADSLHSVLEQRVIDGYRHYLGGDDPAAALAAFDRFRILSAVREGRYGVNGLNHAVERILTSARLAECGRRWYRGRPVMITVNDYSLRLFNGDVGIALPDNEASGGLSVYFPAPDGGIRKLSPLRLPPHETAFAMTVHKSQGSEFDAVLLVVPPVESPVVTRELLYTGITRARSGVELWCGEEIFRRAVLRRIERRSGLREALWGSSVEVAGAPAP